MANKNDKKLENLSNTDLEKVKLISEIRNLKKAFWKHPSFWPPFWTFLIVFIATFYSWKSGLFETKSKILELQTMELDLKRDTLNQQIDSLLIQKIILTRKIDSLTVVIYDVRSEYEGIKQTLASWKKEKQSKVGLQKEVINFVDKLKILINEDKKRDEEVFKNFNEKKNWDEYLASSTQNLLIKNYNTHYKTQTIIYREKLLYFLPSLDIEHNDLSDYQYPTNRIGLEFIVDNLEYMAYKISP